MVPVIALARSEATTAATFPSAASVVEHHRWVMPSTMRLRDARDARGAGADRANALFQGAE